MRRVRRRICEKKEEGNGRSSGEKEHIVDKDLARILVMEKKREDKRA